MIEKKRTAANLSSVFLAIVISLFVNQAWSVVDMRNANYSNTFIAYEKPGTGFPMRLALPYNSRTLHSGMFGFGWCSEFETRIKANPEGSMLLTECGGGQQILYVPASFSKSDIQKVNNQILEKVKVTRGGDRKFIETLTKDLATKADVRSRYAQEYKIQADPKEGIRYFADKIQTEYLEYKKGIFTRFAADGTQQRYNEAGLLVRIADKNGNFIRMEYDKERLREVIDNQGRRLRFVYGDGNRVKQVIGPGEVTAEFDYKGENLTRMKTAWNETFTFEYDDLHNMTKTVFPDQTSIVITYDKQRDWVTSFLDRKKCLETYAYEFNPKTPDLHYWSTVKKTCNDKVVNQSRHEFWYNEKSDGQVALAKVASTINGELTEIAYHPIFSRPTSITRGKITNTYEYFDDGLVKSKEGPMGRVTYKYDDKTRKPKEVVATTFDAKRKPLRVRTSFFRYDLKGNMVEASNTDGQRVKIVPDERGRMVRLEDHAKKVIFLKYNEEDGLPTSITRTGFGTVNIKYKPNGDMEDAVSPQGASTALQIVMTVRSFLDVTSPASAEIYN